LFALRTGVQKAVGERSGKVSYNWFCYSKFCDQDKDSLFQWEMVDLFLYQKVDSLIKSM
jgi:hypothetical protein